MKLSANVTVFSYQSAQNFSSGYVLDTRIYDLCLKRNRKIVFIGLVQSRSFLIEVL